jgi:hypothetical protein
MLESSRTTRNLSRNISFGTTLIRFPQDRPSYKN